MATTKLKSKGVRIDITVKRGNIDTKKLTNSIQSKGFRISPSIPNIPTMAMNSTLKCLLGKDKLEIQVEDIFRLKSDPSGLREVIQPYVNDKYSYQINLEASFTLSGKLNIIEVMDAIYNPRAKNRLKMFVEAIGFRVVIEEDKKPYVLSFEGSRETNNAFCSLAFSTNDNNDFNHVLTNIDKVVNNFIKNLKFFTKNEKNYQASRAKLLKEKSEIKVGNSK